MENKHRVYLTEQQVAGMLQCSVQILRYNRMCGMGLPYVKIGRLVRYDQSAVERYLDEHIIMPRANDEEKDG